MDLESRLLNTLADYAPQLHWALQLRQAMHTDPNTCPRAKAAIDAACAEMVVLLVAGILADEYPGLEDDKLIKSLPNYSRVNAWMNKHAIVPDSLLAYLVGLAAAYTHSNWGTLPWRKVSIILLDQEDAWP